MPNEVLHHLDCRDGGLYVDGTLGGAGHSRLILGASGPGGRLVGVDQDPDAIRNAKAVLAPFEGRVTIVHNNFGELDTILDRLEIEKVDGILVDIGISMHHLEGSGRGFSFMKDEPLDMRMNPDIGVTAADLVNVESAEALSAIFSDLGEEKFAWKVACAIVTARQKAAIRTSRQLADIIVDAIPKKAAAKQKIHPATRTFMGLRIAVNKELERLSQFLDAVPGRLNPGGRIVVLSFHSLEDRIVKQRFRELASPCTCPPSFPVCICKKIPTMRVLTRKAVKPTAEEIAANPPSRSTRLRAAERLADIPEGAVS